jgi:hypothetical protein
MWEEVFKWFAEHYPMLMVMIVLIVVTFIVAKAYVDWGHRVKRVEVEVGKINTRLDSIDTRLNDITTSLNKLITAFNSLIAHLAAKDPTIRVSLFITRSPTELSEEGNKILVDSGGKAWVDHNEEMLMKDVETYINKLHNLPTALDVQTMSPAIVKMRSNSQEFRTIKDYIYNNPFYKASADAIPDLNVPITLDSVANVIGLYLRNLYLEKHPELIPK